MRSRPKHQPVNTYTETFGTPFTVNGLTPNTAYPLSFSSTITYDYWYDEGYDPVEEFTKAYTDVHTNYQHFDGSGMPPLAIYLYTEATVPIINFSNIKNNQLIINWNPNGNSLGTNYDVERRIGAAPWTTIASGTTANSFTDTNLVEETTYSYRVRVNHRAGASWNVYTPEQTVTTTANPAVAAAQEAASAAQAAKLAADSSLQNTQEAKDAAVNTYDQISNPDYGLQPIKNSVFTDGQSAAQWAKMAYDKSLANSDAITNMQSKMAPIITKIDGYGGATCTQSSTFNIVVQSSGATQVRTQINDDSWSEWQPLTGKVPVSGLVNGPNTIIVEVKENNSASAMGQIIVWKL